MKRALAPAAFALSFALALLWTGPCAARADARTVYARELRAVATRLSAEVGSVKAPKADVGPAPLGGPPRFSPSVNDWLQGELRAARHDDRKSRRSDLHEIAATLRYMADEVDRRAPAQPARDVPTTIRAILADPSYVTTETSQKAPEKTLWQRFIEWLAKEFEKLFGGAFDVANASPLFGKLLAIALLASAAALVVALCYRFAIAYLAGRPRRKGETAGDVIGPAVDPAALYQAALQAARERSYARAVALIFQASLVALDRAGAVEFDPARTAGEYRRAVRRMRASAAGTFDRLAHAFTYAAYAERPTGEPEWRDAEGAYRAFESFVRE